MLSTVFSNPSHKEGGPCSRPSQSSADFALRRSSHCGCRVTQTSRPSLYPIQSSWAFPSGRLTSGLMRTRVISTGSQAFLSSSHVSHRRSINAVCPRNACLVAPWGSLLPPHAVRTDTASCWRGLEHRGCLGYIPKPLPWCWLYPTLRSLTQEHPGGSRG